MRGSFRDMTDVINEAILPGLLITVWNQAVLLRLAGRR